MTFTLFICLIGALYILYISYQKESKNNQIYSNYEDHLKNKNHISEINSFQWMNGHPNLELNSDLELNIIYQYIMLYHII